MHKPVLTFGTHSLAGLFLYLFFWVNWENYRLCRSKLALYFALGYVVLLLGLTSFTSLGFAALAVVQMGAWSWKRNPRKVITSALCVVAILAIVLPAVAEEIDSFRELPQLADAAFLNSDLSGPLSRYGPEGGLRPAMNYLFRHPLLPIGLARSAGAFDIDSPSYFFVGDSGPLEYLVRGSVPFLFLVYFGLYRFLRKNLTLRTHGMTIFLVIIAFEAGFSALDSSRTFFLLPFFVVYLNQISSAQPDPRLQEIVPNRSTPILSEARP